MKTHPQYLDLSKPNSNMNTFSPELMSSEFLELASEQRLSILLNLSSKSSTLSGMAKKLDATVPEVHRNFSRMLKSNLIRKNVDGSYDLTLYGKMVCTQVSSFVFMSQNKKYFETHTFGDLSDKFIQRIGSLSKDSKLISGYVKVLDVWTEIYNNAEKYLYNILIEASYNPSIVKIIKNKFDSNVEVHSIFSDDAIVAKDRASTLDSIEIQKFLDNNMLQRRMKKNVTVSIVLNEKECGVSFPTSDGEPDLSKMFYSDNKDFHEWGLDYFRFVWDNSSSFQETKLRH